uniref:Holin n=1 Tax=viral metagenome TaxID=1070528 RepID=A0A6M3JJ12_9ZZZZ
MPQARVEVKSAARSKINWTQVISVVAMGLSYLGFDLAPEDQALAVTAIGVGTSFVTMVLRTWYNRTVTPE